MSDLPPWAGKEVSLFKMSSDEFSYGWEPDPDKPDVFTRDLNIIYPSQLHFEIARLDKEEGWVRENTTFWSFELAYAAARKKAYMQQVPYRIVEVVDRG